MKIYQGCGHYGVFLRDCYRVYKHNQRQLGGETKSRTSSSSSPPPQQAAFPIRPDVIAVLVMRARKCLKRK